MVEVIGIYVDLGGDELGKRALDLLEPRPADVTLEVGTGLGYQAALLSESRPPGLERRDHRGARCRGTGASPPSGVSQRRHRIGDGALGWADHAPYDKITVTAAAELVPPALIQQLKPGGRMVLPTGPAQEQKLAVVEKDSAGRTRLRELMSIRFGLLETVR
jgi:protein-L-isoaspartate(D-aspartate) O-methyltransferase